MHCTYDIYIHVIHTRSQHAHTYFCSPPKNLGTNKSFETNIHTYITFYHKSITIQQLPLGDNFVQQLAMSTKKQKKKLITIYDTGNPRIIRNFRK